ncbi:MAG TPA: ribonuclease R [Pirellulales bacterium]|jgi:ribonuclease R|nr:ribonuclease R [Pirellulales bacterium]
MDRESWEASLLAVVAAAEYRPVKPRVLAKKLGIAAEEIDDFKRLVKRLIKHGKLSWGAKHLVRLPSAAEATSGTDSPSPTAGKKKHSGPTVTGTFRRAQGGFGFVRPTTAKPADGRDHDIYIAAEHTLDAASGDVVLVRPLKAASRNGRFPGTRGAIIEVLERQTRQFVGTYFEAGGNAYVQVDGTLFKDAVYVGDPGAKSARADDKVVFEMVRFPTAAQQGEGVISEVLGPRGQPGIDTLSVIREFDLPEEFAPDALEAARLEADKFDESIPPGRTDMTGEVVITIDPVDARDFDDAISLVRMENGHWLLGVHIADVSHFVRPGTALDREAWQRATSVYLPDRVIPMIPEIISNGLASLQPDRRRYTKTAMIEFTADGARVSVDLHSAVIRSRRRFTYEEVDEYLADREAWHSKVAPEVHALLGRMHELAMMLRGRRMRRGALELTMQEIKIDLDQEGRVAGAHRVVNTVSHQIIEEFMLAANEAVAGRLKEEEVSFLRRIHAAPSDMKVRALNDFVTGLGFETEGLTSRFELQKLLGDVAGQPEQYAVNYAVLRSLQRAEYSPEEDGHYALASDCYCHFTSPIRRYPDLTVHRLVNTLTAGRKPKSDHTELVVLGQHCSDRERRAESAERELVKLKLLAYMSTRIGEEMDAVITGVEAFGLFAQGIEIPAEGLIHISSLGDDMYQHDKATHSLNGRRSGNQYRLGDRVRVKVAVVDIDRRELDFKLVRDFGRPTRGKEHRPERQSKHGDKPKRTKR